MRLTKVLAPEGMPDAVAAFDLIQFCPDCCSDRAMRLRFAVQSIAMRYEARDDSCRFRGRPGRQIELCDRHSEAVIDRERRRGFEIFDHRDWR